MESVKKKTSCELMEALRLELPEVWVSLKEFAETAVKTGGYRSEKEYLLHVEMLTVVRGMRAVMVQQLVSSSTNCSDRVKCEMEGPVQKKARVVKTETTAEDRAAVSARIEALKELETALAKDRDARVGACSVPPRLWRLHTLYGLDATETRILETLAATMMAQTEALRCGFLEDDAGRRAGNLVKFSASSELELESFAEASRDHIKENVVHAPDEAETYATALPQLRLSQIAARVVRGDALSNEDIMATSGTKLEVVLAQEGLVNDDQGRSGSGLFEPGDHQASSPTGQSAVITADDAPSLVKKTAFSSAAAAAAAVSSRGRRTHHSSSTTHAGRSPGASSSKNDDDDDDDNRETLQPSPTSVVALPDSSSGGDNKPTPYPEDNELEYLGEVFEVLALQIRLAVSKMKTAVKEQSGQSRNCSVGLFPAPDEGGSRASARELEAKIRVAEAKVSARCRATASTPRLRKMAATLGLDAWETRVVALLVGRTISPAIKNLMDSLEGSSGGVQRLDDSVTVGSVLAVFCPDSFADQVAHRSRFYKSARLAAKSVVRINAPRWHAAGSTDLTESRVELDRRVLDHVVGLDTELSEVVESSELVSPKARFEDVVLPEPVKIRLATLCEAFGHLGPYAAKTGLFEDAVPYGAGLVVLLTGPSGTGKTLSVHAVAEKLGKRVLQVDFASLRGKAYSSGPDDVDADLRGLFREADMADAVVFFDECESLFRSRDVGGGSDRVLRALLQEIERHKGIVFLATNRPAELDSAMHRRIGLVVEYAKPGPIERRKIWQSLVARAKVRVADDVDWDAVVTKYEITGGFIKNALLSALLFALHRDRTTPILTHDDIRMGCALQQRGVMYKHGSSLGRREKFEREGPDAPKVADLALPENVRNHLEALVDFEQRRGLVFGTWAFSNQHPAQILVLYGPRGAGKRTVASALARTLQCDLYATRARDVAPVVSGSADQDQHHGGADHKQRRLDAIVDDARLSDAVLLVDDFEAALATNSAALGTDVASVSPDLAAVLKKLLTFPGLVVLVAHVDEPSALRFAPDFLRHVSRVLPLAMPAPLVRAGVYRAVVPKNAPLADDVDLTKLAHAFELLPTSIRRAATNAAVKAAARGPHARITQKDFYNAAKDEYARLRGAHQDAMDRLFV